MTTLAPIRLVEAALFSAGKPLAAEEIAQTTKLAPADVTAALKELAKDYAARETALEVVKSGAKWAMAVRSTYSESTKMLAPPEIPRRVLKTLALIAFHQPLKQSDLKKMIGSVVYDHVGELYDRGMVTERQEGITKILATTDRFAEYFGIDASDRETIRTELAKRVGLDLSKKPDGDPAATGEPSGAEQATLDAAPVAEPATL